MTGLGVTGAVVDGMDMREINDLMDYWIDNPPPHIALVQVRDVVISGLGGKPPKRRGDAPTRKQSPEEFAAMLGVTLG
jgi:hypothetical protein